MKIGGVVKPDGLNKHITNAHIEVFPAGTWQDVNALASIPPHHRTYSKRVLLGGQSPVLVRLEFYEQHAEQFLKLMG